ncbi:hemicentin-1, partial [Trichonephila clavata]
MGLKVWICLKIRDIMKNMQDILILLLLGLFLLNAIAVLADDKVDGGWTEWSLLSDSDCSEPCGGGEQTQVRTCTNPKPQNGGKECEGPDHRSIKCNEESCEGRMEKSEWEEWSQCSTTCGQGTRERVKKCVNGEDDGYHCDKVEDKSYQVEDCHEWSPFQRDKCP